MLPSAYNSPQAIAARPGPKERRCRRACLDSGEGQRKPGPCSMLVLSSSSLRRTTPGPPLSHHLRARRSLQSHASPAASGLLTVTDGPWR
ncbi:hypothetical protein BDV95DRAFT_558234 [Massariosphaeria phaeospora]|uniref:Uncharacterized protein n=1 Tax=Massariosphaeria phaeospora TaxID=100035 RepID=A0A7C8IHX5_9PLEO|nr:hypothetical protein BDV95DRAFT_558234 [Massariosphaeria phaeospora]